MRSSLSQGGGLSALMRRDVLRLVLVLLALAALPWPVHAEAEAPFKFASDAQRERYKDLTEQLRCLVCQNETLADSTAPLAGDLRHEIYGMMQQGKDNKQIVNFLVARYGDFVLYRPPLKGVTYLLWFGPFLFLVLGLFVLMYVIRRRNRQSQPELTEEERGRLQQLLGDAGKEGKA
jgi:cytochrome c-type biogenesis protein CcmH